jgi:Arylsulfotransferase (ASST)
MKDSLPLVSFLAAWLLCSLAPGCADSEVEAVRAGAAAYDNPATHEVEGGLLLNAEGAFEGYTLIAPYLATSTFLIDMQGEVVHTWESEHLPAGAPYLLEDGTLLRAADTQNPRFRTAGTGGRLQIFDWNGELLWDYMVSDDTRMQNHDLQPLPNGNVLVAMWEQRSADEAVAAGRDPSRVDEKGLWPCVVIELEPIFPDGANEVWRWDSWEHMVQDRDESLANYGAIAEHPERFDVNAGRPARSLDDAERERMQELEREMEAIGYVGGDEDEPGGGESDELGFMGRDLLHVNAIDYEPELDLIVMSAWEFSEIFVIDHSTTSAEASGSSGGRYGKGGDILYRWGNPQNYGRGGPEDQRFFHQHDSRWLPGPRLLVFNNGMGRPGGEFTTIDELELPFEEGVGFALDSNRSFAPETPAWSYGTTEEERFLGSFISGSQRLPNGNTLICEGPHGRLFEVTREREVVWRYTIPYAGISVGEWWGRFGFGDMGSMEMEDMEDMEDFDDEDTGERDSEEFMSQQAAFRVTRLAPDHPGLQRLKK